MIRIAGLALLALLAVHPWLRPEGAWVLLSTCDLAAIATAVGLIAGWHRVIAGAFLFQLAAGLPALAIGLCTTYPANVTGITVHLMPLIIAWPLVARAGLPPWTARLTWLGYAGSLIVAYAVAPAELNVNFASRVWPPLAGTFTITMFQAALLALVACLLAGGAFGVRRLVVRAR